MNKLLILMCVVMITACGNKNYHLDLYSFSVMPQDQEITNIPSSCTYLYDVKKWEVAVVEFSNNTGYGDMSLKTVNSNTEGRSNTLGVGVGVSSYDGKRNIHSAGVGASHTISKYTTNSTEFMGEFAASLGSFAQSITEETLSQLGGISIINRSHLDKILQEQQFQMTLADPDTVMEFGRLSGVKYIVTGSVDNIQAEYLAPTNIRDSRNDFVAMLSAISASYDSLVTGWFVSASITLNLLDAETGALVYSKTFNGKQRASQSQNFQADIIVNTAKLIMGNAIKDASSELTSIFEVSGYVNEIRGGKKIARINLGSDNGIRQGDVMDIYEVSISTDFFTHEKKCDLIKLDAKLIISNQISPDGSWGIIDGSKLSVKNVKIGSYVRRSDVER